MPNTVALPTVVDATSPVTGRGGQMPSAPLIALRVLITITGTYATGGEDFDPAAQLQALAGYDKAPDILQVLPEQGKGGILFHWDRATNKLIAYEAGTAGAPLDEFGNGDDLAAALGGPLEAVILAQ